MSPHDILSDDLLCDCCDASWPVPADADIDAAMDEAIGAGWGLTYDGETCLCPQCLKESGLRSSAGGAA
ncbi:hypothetical protein J2W68_002109 [Luteimonas terrae]|uniref:Small CPxCG-related zinc finger protein n=1 Tax=Luteimonas terrae TaxID=1530191 RepID=A0ABU1XX88_9GAMM|nr:hypothetical protein [Luteimonas terrae]